MGTMIQTTINRRYEMERTVGEGGMAEVFLGRDLLLHRRVAIKALRPQFASDPAFRARFEREAQAAAGFTHPNIVDIYDVGEEDGTPYLVMEYLEGETLKEIVADEGPFHPDDVAALLEQVGAALDYAHERGYVHRDVKPQNIIVDPNGQAKVVDFGIAKGLADSNLTEAGAGLGTVHYISPEQASGLMATPASDIYSLAVVAYEMLTRVLPFDADTAVGVAMRHIHDAPPVPSAENPDVPPEVDAIVLRALAKDPTRRFPSAGAFAQAMSEWRTQPLSESSPAWPDPDVRPPAPTPIRPDAFETPAPGAPEPTGNGRVTVLRPPSRPAHGATAAVPAATRDKPAPSPAQHDDQIGCTTWLVGSALIVGIVILIIFGSRLVDRINSPDNDASNGRNPGVAMDQLAAPDTSPTASQAPDPGLAESPILATAAPTAAAPVAVPSLLGLTWEQAVTAANNRGFTVEQAGQIFSDEFDEGTVADQDPLAGQPPAQSGKVTVKLSRGSGAVDLASLDLVGKSPDEAETLLMDRGIDVERAEIPSTDFEEGQVAALQPADTASAGDTVTLQVSVGDKVLVPDGLVGQPVDQAQAQLEDLGLRVVGKHGIDRAAVEGRGTDLVSGGIENGDVVSVEGDGVTLDAYVPRDVEITLVFYDQVRDVQSGQ